MGLVDGLLCSEGHFHVPEVPAPRDLSTSQVWALRADTRRKLAVLEHPERIERVLGLLLANILPGHLPASSEDAPLLVPLHSLIPQPALTVESVLGVLLNDPETRTLFPALCGRLEQNVLTVSGIDPTGDSTKPLVPPTQAKGLETVELIAAYLAGTPFIDFFTAPIPFR